MTDLPRGLKRKLSPRLLPQVMEDIRNLDVTAQPMIWRGCGGIDAAIRPSSRMAAAWALQLAMDGTTITLRRRPEAARRGARRSAVCSKGSGRRSSLPGFGAEGARRARVEQLGRSSILGFFEGTRCGKQPGVRQSGCPGGSEKRSSYVGEEKETAEVEPSTGPGERSWPGVEGGSPAGRQVRRRRALVTTLTLERAIAAPATMGDR